jgi:glycosyltransferase involved in cell wall biosynthesis
LGGSAIAMSDPMPPRTVTVVIPTYREVENLPRLVERLRAVRDSGLDIDVLLMDDDSRDGSAERVADFRLPWLRLVTRTTNRGLSFAVLDGLKLSDRDLLVVMDADLSHPPEKIPELLAALDAGADMAVGSRFADGGTTADDWGMLRWVNSRIATFLAWPLTTLRDPMSGFFALRRDTFAAGTNFDPIGYKVLLELIIKCRCRAVIEVPIHFDNRLYGASKLTFKEQLRYLRHLRRLYTYKFGTWSHLAQFLGVGLSGLFVNLGVLTHGHFRLDDVEFHAQSPLQLFLCARPLDHSSVPRVRCRMRRRRRRQLLGNNPAMARGTPQADCFDGRRARRHSIQLRRQPLRGISREARQTLARSVTARLPRGQN